MWLISCPEQMICIRAYMIFAAKYELEGKPIK
jgi:hypothetical protein